jgi:WD40 repeat protein
VEDLSGKQLGQYRIISPLGAGGMAAVFKAYQPSMDRHVAVKVLPRTYANEPGFLARFQQEARVIASLEHPHIVPVHDFGEAEGYTYLVMRYVEGGTLADELHRAPLAIERVQRIVSQLASALDYAHARGIIHRDVKPSNVLIDQQGNCQLTDFGLAKIVENTAQLTVSGAFLGTPKYASPEQGKAEPLSGRSDIYSLGVILYEMATGRVPFEAETPLALLFKHVHDPLPLPRNVNPAIPEQLEKIILKALAKDPLDRFATTDEVATALSQIQADLRAASTLDHAAVDALTQPRSFPWKWVGIGVFAVVLLGLFGFWILPLRESPQVSHPTSIVAEPTKKPPASLQPPPTKSVTQPDSFTPISLDNISQIGERVLFTRGTITVTEINPGADLLAVGGGMGAWIYQLDTMHPLRLLDPGSAVVDLAWSPDNSALALAGLDGKTTIWDAVSGELKFSLIGHSGSLQTVTWSPNGDRLATSAQDGTLRTWSAESGELIQTTNDLTGGTNVLAWGPQGDFIAGGSIDGTVRLWDASKLVMHQLLGSHDEAVDAAIWSPDGSKLMTGGRDGRLRVWDIESGEELFDLLAYGFSVPGLDWSPDGDRVVEAGGLGFLGNVGIWDLEKEEEIEALDDIFLDFVVDVDWSSDGARIIGGTRRGTLVLWQAETGQLLHESRPHAYHATGLSWSPTGQELVTITTEGITHLWDLNTQEETYWDFVDAPAQYVEWSPDGSSIAVAATDGNTYLMNSADIDIQDVLRSGEDFAYAVAWSSDGRKLALAAEAGSLTLWEASSRNRIAVLEGHTDDVYAVEWSPSDQKLASVGNDKTLWIWDGSQGTALQNYQLAAAHLSLAWSPDGDMLALGGLDGILRLLDLERDEVIDVVQFTSWITSLTWSPDRSLLVAGTEGGEVHVYAVEDAEEVLYFKAHNGTVTGLSFSPDGAFIGTTGFDGSVKIWGIP